MYLAIPQLVVISYLKVPNVTTIYYVNLTFLCQIHTK